MHYENVAFASATEMLLSMVKLHFDYNDHYDQNVKGKRKLKTPIQSEANQG